MAKALHEFEASHRHGEIGNERTSSSQRTNMIRELMQIDGVTELTLESTKTESSAIIAYQKPEYEQVSLDAAKVTIHTGWYVNCAQELKT